MPYFLYILHSQTLDQYYVGISSDPEARCRYHNRAKHGWTTRGRPWEVVWKKEFPDRKTAHKWERWLKKQKSRDLIEKLINDQFNWEKSA